MSNGNIFPNLYFTGGRSMVDTKIMCHLMPHKIFVHDYKGLHCANRMLQGQFNT